LLKKIFLYFSILLHRTHRLAFTQSRWVLGLSIVAFLVALSSLPRLKTVLAAHDLVNQDSISNVQLREFQESFKLENPLILSFHSTRVLQIEEIESIDTLMKELFKANPEIVSHQSALDLRRAQVDEESLWFPKIIQNSIEDLKNTPWVGSIVSLKSDDLFYEIIFRNTEGHSNFGAFDPHPVRKYLNELRAELSKLNVSSNIPIRMEVIGSAAYQLFTLEGLMADQGLNLIALFGILLFFRVFLGTWRSGMMFIGILICSVLGTFGMMSIFGAPLDLVNNSLLIILMVATIEDFCMICFLQCRRNLSWRHSLREALVPGFLTSLTTLVGFSSLCFSNATIISRFGFWASFAAALEWWIVFMVFPALLNILKVQRSFATARSEVSFTALNRLSGWIPSRKILILFFLPLFLIPFSFSHLKISDSHSSQVFPTGHPLRDGIDYFFQSRGWKGFVNLVFTSDVLDTEKNEIWEKLRTVTNVAEIENRQSVEKFLTEGVKNELDVKLILRRFRSSDAYDRYVNSFGEERWILYIKDVNLVPLKQSEENILSICQGKCHLTGELLAYATLAKETVTTLLESFFGSFGMVMLILAIFAFMTGQQRDLPALWISSLWGTLCMIPIMAYTQTELNFVTCNFVSIVAGLSGDNAIHYMYAARKTQLSHGIQKRAVASLLTALPITLLTMLFAFSSFKPSRDLAFLLTTGFFLTYVGDVIFMQALAKRK